MIVISYLHLNKLLLLLSVQKKLYKKKVFMNTVYKFAILSCLLLLTTVVYAQNNSDIEKSKSENAVPEAFNKFELAKFNSIPELKLPESYKNLQSNPLPAILDNSTLQFFRPVFNQVSLECGQASGIGQGFTYEMNYARN